MCPQDSCPFVRCRPALFRCNSIAATGFSTLLGECFSKLSMRTCINLALDLSRGGDRFHIRSVSA
jgi:hypothetical protein